MTRHVLIGMIVLLFAQVGQAQIIPAITSVFTEGDELYIAGQNLPNGWGTKVRFGDNQLAVSSASDTLIVAKLPAIIPQSAYKIAAWRGLKIVTFDYDYFSGSSSDELPSNPPLVVTTSATIDATSVPDATFYDYCSDANGCMVSIGARNGLEQLYPSVTGPVRAMRGTMPCKVHMSMETPSERYWTVSGCPQGPWSPPDWTVAVAYGVDGVAPNSGVLGWRRVCFLAENDRSGATTLLPDDSLGFFFLRWEDPADIYDDDELFECVLIVED